MATLELQPVPPAANPGTDMAARQAAQTAIQTTQTSTASLNMNFLGANPTTTGTSTVTGATPAVNPGGLGSLLGTNSFMGLGIGTGLSSLLLPNMSTGTRSLFAAAVEFPVITALATTFWTSSITRSPIGGGFLPGLFAGIFLGNRLSGQNDT